MSKSKILLQGGTLLLHDADDHVVPTVADLLVEDSFIVCIKDHIVPDTETKVVHCTGKIVSPGFIDTHRHLWQTQYKGSHVNHTLVEYMVRGNFTGVLWSAEDLFWGELSGAMESISAGTTTLVDHANCNISPEHPQSAIQALLTSGMRAVYCYTPRRRLQSRDPLLIEDEPPEAALAEFQALARAAPLGDGGRVLVGFANDAVYGPLGALGALYAQLRDPARGRAHLITTHAVGGPMYPAGARTVAGTLGAAAVLGPDVLLSHGCCPHADDGPLLRASGARLACTPGTELQMGYEPVALRDADHRAAAGLGVDCHSWGGSSGIPEQMRLLLQAARSARGVAAQSRGLWNLRVGFAAEDVFNLGTVGGARACGLEGQVGRLREGMKADIVVFDGETPGMLAAAAEDPVGAVVLYSSPADIDMVLVDGLVRKEGGKLLGVTVASAPNESMSVVKPGTKTDWNDVVPKVLESRKSLKQKAEGIDFDKAEQVCMNLFHMNTEAMLEVH